MYEHGTLRHVRSRYATLWRREMPRFPRFLLPVLIALASLLGAQSAFADAPNMASGNGITVSGWRWITSRTFEVDISTAKVSSNAIVGPNRVRITFPADY